MGQDLLDDDERGVERGGVEGVDLSLVCSVIKLREIAVEVVICL